jgi:hypothetical protein
VSGERSRFAKLFPTVAALLENGVELPVNGGGCELQIAALYKENRLATDEVNGAEYSVW